MRTYSKTRNNTKIQAWRLRVLRDSSATFVGLRNTPHGPPVYQNDGLADDLDGDLVMDNVVSRGSPEASMSMELLRINQNLAGRKNSRDDE